jgi:hypothetical protein
MISPFKKVIPVGSERSSAMISTLNDESLIIGSAEIEVKLIIAITNIIATIVM